MNCNKAIIIGRLTRDPELRTTQNGTTIATISVATSTQWKDKSGNKQQKTEFHNVVSFGKQAEVIGQYFTKGQEIYVEGRLETQSWEDKETGKKMYRTEIVMEKFEFGAKPVNAQPQQAVQPRQENVPTIDLDADPVDPEDVPYDENGNPDNIKIEDVPF